MTINNKKCTADVHKTFFLFSHVNAPILDNFHDLRNREKKYFIELIFMEIMA